MWVLALEWHVGCHRKTVFAVLKKPATQAISFTSCAHL